MPLLKNIHPLALLAFFFPSFHLYSRLARHQNPIPILNTFVVLALFFTFSLMLDPFLGGWTIYSILKWIILFYIAKPDKPRNKPTQYTGAEAVFNRLFAAIFNSLPRLMKYANDVQINDNLVQNTGLLFTNVIQVFKDQYETILSQIDDIPRTSE